MSHYLCAMFNVHDWDLYNRYAERSAPIFIREGVKVLAADNNPRIDSVDNVSADRVVLLEFRDKNHMKHFFSLEDYQEVAKDRLNSSTGTVMNFEPFQIPKTTS
jgi:uncharacterized protein (DUF1330 family)